MWMWTFYFTIGQLQTPLLFVGRAIILFQCRDPGVTWPSWSCTQQLATYPKPNQAAPVELSNSAENHVELDSPFYPLKTPAVWRHTEQHGDQICPLWSTESWERKQLYMKPKKLVGKLLWQWHDRDVLFFEVIIQYELPRKLKNNKRYLYVNIYINYIIHPRISKAQGICHHWHLKYKK